MRSTPISSTALQVRYNALIALFELLNLSPDEMESHYPVRPKLSDTNDRRALVYACAARHAAKFCSPPASREREAEALVLVAIGAI